MAEPLVTSKPGTEVDGPVKLAEFAHVSVPCRDLDEGKRFYGEVLGGVLRVDTPTFASFKLAGVDIGIGTDGCHCSDNQNMFEAMRAASFVSRVRGLPPSEWLSAAEALELATEGSARVLGFQELIGRIAEEATGDRRSILTDAYQQVEEEEDMHLYHTMGWARELWIESLGMPAVLPPPEEEKKVKTAIGASRAEQSRDDML